MGQPTPPGDHSLYEGLDPSWNDFVGAFPEEQRSDLAGKLKSRIDSYQEQLKPWEDFNKSGISPDQARQGLELFNVIESDPKRVYDLLGNHLGLTQQEVKEAVQTMEQTTDDDDPRIATMQQQLDTLAQIALAQRQQTAEQQQQAAQDKALEDELNAVKKKYGDVDEEQIIMRMLHKNLTAEQAYQEYTGRDAQIRSRRPAPQLLGSGGNVPDRAIDPTKLDRAGTKDIVAQMMQHAAQQGR